MKVTLGGQTLDLLTVKEFSDAVYGTGNDPNDPSIRANTDPEATIPIGKSLKALAEFARRQRPTDNDLQASATATAAGVATLDFGAPDAGQVWDVRRISIIGQDVNAAAVTCTVRVFKRSVEAFTVVDASGTQVPTTATYSRHQCTIKPGENVLVRVNGFTASGTLFGMMQVEQTRWGASEKYEL